MLVESLIAVAFGLIGYWIGSNWPAKRHCPPHQYEKCEAEKILPYFVCLKCGHQTEGWIHDPHR